MMVSCGSNFDISAYTFDTSYTLNNNVDSICLTFLFSFDTFHALVWYFCFVDIG